MHTYRRKAVIILFSLLLVFFLIAVFSYVQLKREISILSIGLPYDVEDTIILVLSALSMLKVIHEIQKVEHHHEYERRVRKAV